MEVVAWILGFAFLTLLLLAGLAAMAQEDDIAVFLTGASFVSLLVCGVIALINHASTPRAEYRLYCVDGNAVVVSTTHCENETRPGAFWLWIGDPATPIVAERTKAPADGVLVDATNGDAWKTLELNLDEVDLPDSGSVHEVDESALREIGMLR